MICFDKDEKLISDALDALDQKMTTPDLLAGIRKKLPKNAHSKRIRRPFRFTAVFAALVAIIGITATAMSIGGFDWLCERVNFPFKDVVMVIERNAQSEGIKVTAVAAQHYGDMAILYVTLEDTEGLSRVTRDMQLSFVENSNVQSISSEMVYFEESRGIAAYQIRLGTPKTFNGQLLSLKMDSLRYRKTNLDELRMDIDLTEAVAEGEHIGEPYINSKQIPSEELTPGHIADIPGTSAWVSAIGISHGYLTVQFGQPTGEHAVSMYQFHPYLLGAEGNRVDSKHLESGFLTNGQLKRPKEGEQVLYDFTECYFSVDTDKLDGYTLCFEGDAWNVVTGKWNLDIDFDSISEVREITSNITLGGVQMTDVVLTISPLGLTMTGNGAQDVDLSELVDTAILETTAGDIELRGVSGSRPYPSGPFLIIWQALSDIDMNTLIAVRIGNNRIEF